jgi:hypothetical protein
MLWDFLELTRSLSSCTSQGVHRTTNANPAFASRHSRRFREYARAGRSRLHSYSLACCVAFLFILLAAPSTFCSRPRSQNA